MEVADLVPKPVRDRYMIPSPRELGPESPHRAQDVISNLLCLMDDIVRQQSENPMHTEGRLIPTLGTPGEALGSLNSSEINPGGELSS